MPLVLYTQLEYMQVLDTDTSRKKKTTSGDELLRDLSKSHGWSLLFLVSASESGAEETFLHIFDLHEDRE